MYVLTLFTLVKVFSGKLAKKIQYSVSVEKFTIVGKLALPANVFIEG